jgi:hypothetical protein
MSPVPGERGDEYRAAEEIGVVLEPIGAVLAGTEEAIERVRRTWDVGFQDAMRRLDEIRDQVDEAVRLTRVLVARRRATR